MENFENDFENFTLKDLIRSKYGEEKGKDVISVILECIDEYQKAKKKGQEPTVEDFKRCVLCKLYKIEGLKDLQFDSPLLTLPIIIFL